METTINHGAVAAQNVTVTNSVEEAIRLVHTFDNMLNAIVCAVAEGEEGKMLLDDALTANIFIGKLRGQIYNAVLGENKS